MVPGFGVDHPMVGQCELLLKSSGELQAAPALVKAMKAELYLRQGWCDWERIQLTKESY